MSEETKKSNILSDEEVEKASGGAGTGDECIQGAKKSDFGKNILGVCKGTCPHFYSSGRMQRNNMTMEAEYEYTCKFYNKTVWSTKQL